MRDRQRAPVTRRTGASHSRCTDATEAVDGFAVGTTDSNEACFTAMYERHRDDVRRLCQAILRDRAEAEDATDEVFAKSWLAMIDGRPTARSYPWLRVVARNHCYDLLRKRGRSLAMDTEALEDLGPSSEGCDGEVIGRVEVELARQSLRRIPSSQQAILHLRDDLELSSQQIAALEATSLASVESRLFRARRSLRREFLALVGPEGLASAIWFRVRLRWVDAHIAGTSAVGRATEQVSSMTSPAVSTIGGAVAASAVAAIATFGGMPLLVRSAPSPSALVAAAHRAVRPTADDSGPGGPPALAGARPGRVPRQHGTVDIERARRARRGGPARAGATGTAAILTTASALADPGGSATTEPTGAALSTTSTTQPPNPSPTVVASSPPPASRTTPGATRAPSAIKEAAGVAGSSAMSDLAASTVPDQPGTAGSHVPVATTRSPTGRTDDHGVGVATSTAGGDSAGQSRDDTRGSVLPIAPTITTSAVSDGTERSRRDGSTVSGRPSPTTTIPPQWPTTSPGPLSAPATATSTAATGASQSSPVSSAPGPGEWPSGPPTPSATAPAESGPVVGPASAATGAPASFDAGAPGDGNGSQSAAWQTQSGLSADGGANSSSPMGPARPDQGRGSGWAGDLSVGRGAH